MDPPPVDASPEPGYTRRSPPEPMARRRHQRGFVTPPIDGSLESGYVPMVRRRSQPQSENTPVTGSRGPMVRRRTPPQHSHTPQPQPPPPPGSRREEKAKHVPGPSVVYNQPCSYNQLPPPLTPSQGPPLLHRKNLEWGIDFYIRVDHAGHYHTYPSVGGPFEKLHAVENAIEHFLDDRRDPKMSRKDNVSAVDIAVKHCLYWPDGKRRKSSGMEAADDIRDSRRQLANALVDKYNEDNYLFGDHAYELTKVELYESFCEGDVRMWYNHINFTAKAKGAAYSKVFFGEVISMQGEEFPVTCLCVIQSTDNGFCFSCGNKGNRVRHPNSVRFVGGHVMRTFMPFNGPKLMGGYCDNLEADEARFRYTLEGCDLSRPVVFPGSLAKVYTGPPVWDGGCWRMEEVRAGAAS